MTEDEFRAELAADAKAFGSQRAYARHLGVSAPYLNDVIRGNRSAGNKILSQYGMRRVVTIVVDIERLMKEGMNQPPIPHRIQNAQR